MQLKKWLFQSFVMWTRSNTNLPCSTPPMFTKYESDSFSEISSPFCFLSISARNPFFRTHYWLAAAGLSRSSDRSVERDVAQFQLLCCPLTRPTSVYVLYTHLVSSVRKISALQGHKSYSVVGTEKPHNFSVRAGAYLPVSVGCWAGFGLTVAAFIRRAIQEVSSVLGQLSFFIWCSLASISLSLGEGYHWLEQCFWHTWLSTAHSRSGGPFRKKKQTERFFDLLTFEGELDGKLMMKLWDVSVSDVERAK